MNIKPLNPARIPKKPTEPLKIVGAIDDYVRIMLDSNGVADNVVKTAIQYRTPVKIAQDGELIKVNAGTLTSCFHKSDLKKGSDFESNIINVIRQNSALNNHGIDVIV